MPKTRFKCSRCKRSFSMAAHLARHMTTIHAVKKRVVRTQKTAAARSSTKINKVMHDHYNGLLAQRSSLNDQRSSLDAQIDAFAQVMESMGVTTHRRSVDSALRPGSLKSYIVRVLRQSSKAMGLDDIMAQIRKAGYKTKAKDLKKAISNTIPSLTNVKRVSFGQYQI